MLVDNERVKLQIRKYNNEQTESIGRSALLSCGAVSAQHSC